MADFNPIAWRMMYRDPARITWHPSWVGHIPFAFALVEMMRPRMIVELGAYQGTSYCAFCQAVAELRIAAKCFAIDTWQGDAHTGGYGEGILNDLRAHHDPLYGSFSQLIQETFDDARKRFADGTIDLLHIDGLHTYDAVKHDFESWRPKFSECGVVLFHDTAERKEDFGVWRLWEELRQQYPSFEFTHSSGLGVLAVGASVPPAVRDFLDIARRDPPAMQRIFETLGSRIEAEITLHRLGEFFDQSQQFVDRWKSAIGQPPADPPHNGHTEPILAAQRMARDLSALSASDPRRKGK